MAPVLLSQSESKHLVKKLENAGYQSLQVRSSLIMEFHFKAQDLQVWVDSWPEFTTVLLVKLLPDEKYIHQLCYIFSSDEEKLKELLKTPKLILWGHVIFVACPIKFKAILQEFAEIYGCSLTFPKYTFQLHALNRMKSKPWKVPEEVIVSSLTPDQAEAVFNNWEFSKSENKEDELKNIKMLIESYPTLSLFNSEGRLIAYAIGQMYGGMGMLHVEPEYRNRGYGKTVMYLLSQKYSDVGYPAFVSLAEENTISNKIHHYLGFEPTGCFINWYTLRVKGK